MSAGRGRLALAVPARRTCVRTTASRRPARRPARGPQPVADQLIIRGAREHNLKDISLDLPRDSLIVFTGLSGSGKSSLAFDTIFAEGQRRYVESLSAYARQFLGQMDKPDVDFIEGLSPGGLDRPEVDLEEPPLDRRHHHRGLRLPPAALRPRRPAALPGLRRADRAADAAADRRPGARARGGHPLPGAGAGDPRPQGRVRRAVPAAPDQGLLPGPGRRRDARRSTEPPKLDKQKKHTIEVVVDRLAVKASSKRRLTDSVETALGLAGGLVVARLRRPAGEGPRPRAEVLREDGLPQRPPVDIDELEPRSFSFNSPVRRLPRVPRARHPDGGRPRAGRPRRRRRPSARARSSPWSQAHVADYFLRLMGALGEELGFDLNTPWEQAARPRRARSLLDGHPTKVHVVYQQPLRPRARLLRRVRGRRSLRRAPARARPSPTPAASGSRASCARCPCPACQGSRLKPVSRSR